MSDKVFRNIIKTKAGIKVIEEIFKMITGIKVKIEPKNDEIKVTNKYIKGKRVDLLSEDKKKVLNLEVNNNGKADLVRNMTYLFSIFINNIMSGKNYNLKKTFYQINFSYRSKLRKIMSEYGVYELIEGINILPMLKMIEFDMVKIRNVCYNNDVKGIDKLYRYIGMLLQIKNY